MKYKQIIQLPDKVSQSVFDLPCVHAIYKGFHGLEYTLFVDVGRRNIMTTATPGDYLSEDYRGHWQLLNREQGEQYLKENNITIPKRNL